MVEPKSLTKTAILWIAGVAGWLVFSAVLGSFGLSVAMLLILHLLATGIMLAWIMRRSMVAQAVLFRAPVANVVHALTPYGGAASWLSGFGTVGLVAAIVMWGEGAFVLLAAIIGGMVVVGTIVAPVLAEARAQSLKGWIAGRFGPRAEGAGGAVLTLAAMAILIVQMMFAGLVAEAVVGVSRLVVVPVVVVLTMVSVLGGGVGGMVRSQAALFLFLLVGAVVPALWLGMAQTGIVVPHVAPGALLHEMTVAQARLGEVSADPFGAMLLGVTVMLGLIALPHTLVRWPTEDNGVEARRFVRRSTVMAVLVIAALPLFALAGRAAWYSAALAEGAAMPDAATSGQALAMLVTTLDPPAWLLATAGAGALAAIVAACAGAVMVAIDALGGDAQAETAGTALSRYRWIGAAVVVIAAVVSLFLPFDPLLAAFVLLAFAASAFLSPLMLGLLWPGMTGGGALAGMASGAVACIALMAWGYSAVGGMAVCCAAVSALVSVAISLIRPDQPQAAPVRFMGN